MLLLCLLLLGGMSLMLLTHMVLCWFSAWAALAAWGCVDEGFDLRIVRRWCGGYGNNAFEDGIEMCRESVTTWVDVNGGAEGLDVNCLFDAPFDPILLRCDDGNVIFAEMMLVFSSVLKHCGFVVTKSICGC